MEASRHFQRQINRLTEISIALSAELDLDVLLEKIVRYARELAGADGGTLYLLQDGLLHFKILQNESLGVFQGGASGEKIDLEPVPLEKTNVSAYAALLKKTVRVKDVYDEHEHFDFSGPRKYDAVTGYRSGSMLVVPMKDHEGTVTGVLQLMNALGEDSGEATVFSDEATHLTEALASQAAVAINNARLIKETKDLFDGLTRVLAVAVDAKSPSTGNHIQRVALFNAFLARRVNQKNDGPLAGVHFSEKELEEIRLAGWLHDVGKVTTPVWVMEKVNKLEGIYDRMDVIRNRFRLFEKCLELEAMRGMLERCDASDAADVNLAINEDLSARRREMADDLAFLELINKPRESLPEDAARRLDAIAQKRYPVDGKPVPAITEDECGHLKVNRGNLTLDEIQIMRDHVIWSKKMLDQVPFKGHLKNVPLYAGQHHEKLNGSGYPEGLKNEDIPLQSRILAVADVYEALAAKDRSYKEGMSEEQIIEILKQCVKRGELDPAVAELLISDRVYRDFEEEYAKSQEPKGPESN